MFVSNDRQDLHRFTMASSSYTVIFLLVLPKLIAADEVLTRPTRVPGSSHLIIKSEFPYIYWRASPRPYTPTQPSAITQNHTSYPYFYGEFADEHVSNDTTWQAMPIQLPDDLVGAFDEKSTHTTTTQTPPYPTQVSPQYGRHPGVTERPHLFHPERLYPPFYNKANRVVKTTNSFNSSHRHPILKNTTVTIQHEFNIHDPYQESSKLPLWHGSLVNQLKMPKPPKVPNMVNSPIVSPWPMNVQRKKIGSVNHKSEPQEMMGHAVSNGTPTSLYPTTLVFNDQPNQNYWQNTKTYQPGEVIDTSKDEPFEIGYDYIDNEYYYDYESKDYSHDEYSDDWRQSTYYPNNPFSIEIPPSENSPLKDAWKPEQIKKTDKVLQMNHFHSYDQAADDLHTQNQNTDDTQYNIGYRPVNNGGSSDQGYQPHRDSYNADAQVLQKHHHGNDHRHSTLSQKRPTGGFSSHWSHGNGNKSSITPLQPNITQVILLDNVGRRPTPEGTSLHYETSDEERVKLLRRPKPVNQEQTYFRRPYRHPRPRPGQPKWPNSVDRITMGDSVTTSVLVPGGMLIVAIALALFYFNFVWYPTPVVTARLIQRISDSAPDNFLDDSQRKAVEEMYEVFRSLESEYMGDPELWTDVCNSRFVCQVHNELPGLWRVTQICASFIRSSLVRDPQENNNYSLYLEAAQRGSQGLDCAEYYSSCNMRQIPIRLSLQKALSFHFENTTEIKNS
ncbi:uncharacterized protein LOC122255807 [Penaeus japonicus]|uniref:uncharacterized protein LOC122255807 n=1 Tax=Penaeus japonicus TaxID=27405 RepID=UPI001C70AFE7|nr:uncharacterized protein LOC122255807 [Penaeus japonicus]